MHLDPGSIFAGIAILFVVMAFGAALAGSRRSPTEILKELDGSTSGSITGFVNRFGETVTEPHLFRTDGGVSFPSNGHYQVWYEYEAGDPPVPIKALQDCEAIYFNRSGLSIGSTVAVRYMTRNPRYSCFRVPGDPTGPWL